MTEQKNAKASALTFDPAEYAHFLEGTGWTDAQKSEFTSALWGIVVSFVDLAYGSHPAQQCQKTTLFDDSSKMLPSGVISKNTKPDIASAFKRSAMGVDS